MPNHARNSFRWNAARKARICNFGICLRGFDFFEKAGVKFSLIGPKQYGLCLLNLETGEITFELKLRGFTLDERTSATLNYAAFRRLVLENAEIREGITVAYSRLQPNLHGGVQTRLQNKLYEPVLNKGIFLPDDPNTIYPFGYISGGPIQYGPAP